MPHALLMRRRLPRSYGILLWEIATRGQTPYGNLGNKEAKKAVRSGHHPERPEDCNAAFYNAMKLVSTAMDARKR